MNETQFSSYAAHVFAGMQTFQACTFFVNHCVWQALHKTQMHTSSHGKGLVLKPWNHMKTCRELTNHEKTAQSTRNFFAQCSWTLGPHLGA
jgi:hypothetical protein